MKIVIETIASSQQRYDTWGDWWLDADHTLQIRVSSDEPAMPTGQHQLCVAIHELVEALLCIDREITVAQVDEFDMVTAPALALADDDEPGDHPLAPYRKEHRFAMLLEHLMARELGLDGYGVVR